MKKILAIVSCLIFSLGFSHHLSASEPMPPAPSCSEDCYFIKSSSLYPKNVSQTYADSIFREVKTILYEYLGKGKMDSIYFLYPEYVPKLMGTLLILSCTVGRRGDFVDLLVTIEDDSTHEEYFNFHTTSCFFTPNELLRAFSSSFAEGFKLQILNDYHYVAKNEGYVVSKSPPGIMLDLVSYPEGDLIVDLGDLVDDLRNTDKVPKSFLDGISSYSSRKSFENVAGFISGIAFGAAIVPFFLAILSDSALHNDRLVFGITSALGGGYSL